MGDWLHTTKANLRLRQRQRLIQRNRMIIGQRARYNVCVLHSQHLLRDYTLRNHESEQRPICAAVYLDHSASQIAGSLRAEKRYDRSEFSWVADSLHRR